MMRPVNIFWRLVMGALFFLGTGSFFLASASNGKTIMGREIPLMDDAGIVKESIFQGSGRFELDVGASLDAVARFYNQAMEIPQGDKITIMFTRGRDNLVLEARQKQEKVHFSLNLLKKIGGRL